VLGAAHPDANVKKRAGRRVLQLRSTQARKLPHQNSSQLANSLLICGGSSKVSPSDYRLRSANDSRRISESPNLGLQ
jgi:hypothetical protein